MLSVLDSDELKKREIKKKKLENELKVAENNCLEQKKFSDDLKQRMLSPDENTRKMITGRAQIRLGVPTKVPNRELISTSDSEDNSK